MKKAHRIINIIAALLLVITSICTVLFLITDNSRPTSEWFRKSEKGYTVVGKQSIGTSWGGTSRALIEIFDTDNKVIVQFETGIATDGKSLSEKNYRLSVNDDYIALAFYNENKTLSGAYRFYYEDFKGG